MGAKFPLSELGTASEAAVLPGAADVVVIGGGVIGVCTALYLARDGKKVVLLEKGRIAAEQSSRNWGWIRQQGRDPHELPLMVEANALWQALAHETHVDIGLTRGGVAYLARDDAALDRYAAWLPYAKTHGVDTSLLSAAQMADLIPAMGRSYKGALYTASDMRAEPWCAVPALAGIARRNGARLFEGCAVRCLDIQAGRVAGVVTERGRIAADRVVLAAGAWSALFLANHGVRLPQVSVRATVAATTPLPSDYGGGASDPAIAFRHRTDGGYTLAASAERTLFIGPAAVRSLPRFVPQLRADPFGTQYLPAAPKGFPDAWATARRWDGDMQTPFERMRILDPKPSVRRLAAIKRDFAALFPRFPAFEFTYVWAGMIDTLPDLVPVVDRVPQLPGLTVGTGMSGHGFGIGPAMGRVLAALAQDRAPGQELQRFALSRFSYGSEIRPGPAL